MVLYHQEDGELVLLEVTPNQYDEFASGAEEDTETEDSDEENGQNNNAMKVFDQDDDDPEVQILHHSKEEIEKAEEIEMQKFMDFMKRQGLMLMQTPTAKTNDSSRNVMERVNKQSGESIGQKADKAGAKGMSGIDSHSVITVYQNAVQPASILVDGNKRASSSSEEQMDTSDELDDGQIKEKGNLTNNLDNDRILQYVAEAVGANKISQVVCDGEMPHSSRDDYPPPRRYV